MNPQVAQGSPHSAAWITFTYASFFASVGMVGMGVLFAPVDIWIKVGYQFQINTAFLYYTTGTGTNITNPEGAFGVGKGNTQVVQAHFFNHDSTQNNIDWWKATIPDALPPDMCIIGKPPSPA